MHLRPARTIFRPEMWRNRKHSGKLMLSGVVAAGILGLSSVLAAARQSDATGSVPTSALPPQTNPAAIPLVHDRSVMPVNNAIFGESGNVYEVEDQTPLTTTTDYVAYSRPDATSDDIAASVTFGVIPAATVVQPLFIRGDRVYVYIPSTDSYAWLGSAR
jgi:hypothetical protein